MNGQTEVLTCIFCHDWQLDYTAEAVETYIPGPLEMWPTDRLKAYGEVIEFPLKEHVRTEHPAEWANLHRVGYLA